MPLPEWVVTEGQARDDYSMLVTFSRGEQKLFNALPLLQKKLYQPLKNPAFFCKASVSCGTVVWSDDIDIAPEYLYSESKPVSKIQ